MADVKDDEVFLIALFIVVLIIVHIAYVIAGFFFFRQLSSSSRNPLLFWCRCIHAQCIQDNIISVFEKVTLRCQDGLLQTSKTALKEVEYRA